MTALVKLLWDFRIQTDHHLDHNRPDIVVLEKEGRMCFIVNVACPFDTWVAEKETEKIDHYYDLKRGSAKDLELQKCICHHYCNWSS